jgi:hypothetical protein
LGRVLLIVAAAMLGTGIRCLVMPADVWTWLVAFPTALAAGLMARRRLKRLPNPRLAEVAVIAIAALVAYLGFIGISPSISDARTEIQRHPDGSMKTKIAFVTRNGVRVPDGEALAWYQNGKLQGRTQWKGGQKHGINESWYQDGQLCSRGTFKGGEPDGTVEFWYPGGSLKSREGWRNGKRHGRSRTWSADGTLQHDLVFDNGVLVGPFREGGGGEGGGQ